MAEKKKTIKAVAAKSKPAKAVKKPAKPKKETKVEDLELVKEEKIVEKAEEKVAEVIAKAESRKYFYAVGKRKTSVAQVRIYPVEEKDAKILVNGKEALKYFPILRLLDKAKESLTAVGKELGFEVVAKVRGGGVSSQAEAVRLGVARALIKFDENLRKALKARGLLTRDSRKVERKKPGLKKARRAPQWAKR